MTLIWRCVGCRHTAQLTLAETATLAALRQALTIAHWEHSPACHDARGLRGVSVAGGETG